MAVKTSKGPTTVKAPKKAAPKKKQEEPSAAMQSAASYEIVKGPDGKERIKLGEYPAGQPVVWLNLLFLGLVASLACFIIWNLVMSKLGNVTSTNYVYLNPVFTLITAALILGERMSPMSVIGCTAILAGVILAGRRS